jgi:hypothetical protein
MTPVNEVLQQFCCRLSIEFAVTIQQKNLAGDGSYEHRWVNTVRFRWMAITIDFHDS